MYKYHITHYEYNPRTNYFEKSIVQTDLKTLKRLPYELHFEPTQMDHIKFNAETLLTSKKAKDKYIFYTGVQPLHNLSNWYVGNIVEKMSPTKITSLVIVHHEKELGKITIYYFRYFDKMTTRLRHAFAKDFICNLPK